MKTVLIATDFSAGGRRAAFCGYRLAARAGVGVVLLHAIIVPAEIPQSGLVAWPDTFYDELLQDGLDELDRLKVELELLPLPVPHRPAIRTVQQISSVMQLLQDELAKQPDGLVVMGTHGNDRLGTLLTGDHCRAAIIGLSTPVLFVPPTADPKRFGKLLFASDFTDPASDMVAIRQLVRLAQPTGAAIILVHTHNGSVHAAAFREAALIMLQELADRARYDRISCEVLEGAETEAVLSALVKTKQADLLALVHHQHNWVHELLLGDHSKRMEAITAVPLLVFTTKRSTA